MTEYLDRLSTLPPRMAGAMQRYIERGFPPGSFLEAVLSNDMMGALGRADAENRAALHDYGVFLYSYAPGGCHGSPDKVRDWIKRGGLLGGSVEDESAVAKPCAQGDTP